MSQFVAEGVTVNRQGRTVLQKASLIVRPGELVALIGPNGAGKSTMLRTLSSELRPASGRCYLDHTDIYKTSARHLARRRAVLPQNASTDFPLIAEEVVALGRAPWQRHASPARNRLAIREASAAAGASRLLSRDYRRLSGGERQRVQLARVLAQIWDVHWDDSEARYLLLDEPAASLDVGHQQHLLVAVRQILTQRVGVLAVMHNLNLAAAFADRIYLLADGCIRAEGTPEAVIRPMHINSAYAAEMDVRTDTHTGRPMVLPSAG